MDTEGDTLASMRAAMDQFGAMTVLITDFMAEYRRHLLAAGFPEEEAANLTADLHQIWWERQLAVTNR